jgi:hypothetical protein
MKLGDEIIELLVFYRCAQASHELLVIMQIMDSSQACAEYFTTTY